MSSIISKASQAIRIWNEVRKNPTAVINYFNQGAYFQLFKEDYTTWKSRKPSYIHAYLGLVQPPTKAHFSLSMFSVDNITDKTPVETNWEAFETNLKHNPYRAAIIPDPSMNLIDSSPIITPLEGLTRSIQWALHKDLWIEKQNDLVQVFEIPFSDLSVLFEEEFADYIILSPALKEQETPNAFAIDLILWGYNSNGVTWNRSMDFLRPAPPFSFPSNFQLIKYAL